MAGDQKRLRSRVLEMARKDERAGDWPSAVRRYTRLSGLEPNDPSWLIKLGDLHLRMDAPEEAAEAFFRAGSLFSKAFFDDKAAAVYRRGFEAAPHRAEPRGALIQAYRRLGRIPEAIGVLERASDLADQAGDREAALRLRREIAELDPLAVETRLRLARDLEATGRRSEALHEYTESLLELLRQGDFPRALGVFDTAIALGREAPAAAGGEASDDGEVVEDRESRAHREGIERIYRQAALLYHRQRGFA